VFTTPRPEPIYYCATGEEMPLYEALQGQEGSEGHLIAASNQIFLVIDARTPVAAFTARPELKAYLRRQLDAFINLLVCTFWNNQGPSIMTMSSAVAE
jgi:hypothetical protein